ncbi:MAG TPA: phytanoyl-CoA dioxygenase family protein [Opitutus sp.]|nr:phytanoyl-CoA dioxygenase family protein [Opitutus sp.]
MTSSTASPLHTDLGSPPPAVLVPGARVPTRMEEYLFDLQGFIVLRGALSKDEVAACNETIDRIPASVPRNGWFGHVHREDHPEHRGISYQQVYEAGPAFERLIDHPSWINYVSRFVGGHDTFDWHHGPVFIDENFVNLRGPGESIALHSGGHTGTMRTLFHYADGRFHCGQVNVLLGLTDIGPGDGATMVIPASHKANIKHPEFDAPNQKEKAWGEGGGASVDGITGAIEVHLAAGDAIVFVDATCHGSAKRVNPGLRRICVYRYGPSWGNFRWGYEPSDALVSRLNPLAKKIVRPQQGLRPPAAAAGHKKN